MESFIHLRISTETRNKLKSLCAIEGITIQGLVRELINDYIKKKATA